MNPWKDAAAFAESCALIETIRVRRGMLLEAQEAADELKLTTNILGTVFAARIIEEAIARASIQQEQAA